MMKFGHRLNALAGAFLFFGIATMAFGQSDEPSRPQGFIKFKELPYRIAVHQAYPDFWTHVERLNAEFKVLDLDHAWTPFSEADIYVVSLNNLDDMRFVPALLGNTIEKVIDLSNPTFVQAATYGFEGETYHLMVVIKEELSGEALEDIGCVAAVALFDGIIGFSDDASDTYYNECRIKFRF